MRLSTTGSSLLQGVLAIGVLLLTTQVMAQSYTNVTGNSGVDTQCAGLWGGGVSFFDYDSDNIVDITYASGNGGIVSYKGNGDGTFEDDFQMIQFTGQAKTVLWVDYDNDLDFDLFINGFDQVALFRRDETGFTQVTESVGIEQTGAQGTGACFGDINNDGWLDLYICNYDYLPDSYQNYLYLSDGEGNFIDVTEEYGVGDGYSPTFQATFFDMERDGDLDLFVINDRDDYYNTMYRNDGGYFTEVGQDVDLKHDMWSMSNTIDDFNNDGMLDIYVTNGTEGNRLFLNNMHNNGTFIDVTDDYGVEINAFCWSAGFTDYDNDGWKDLMVLSEPYFGLDGEHFFFRNEQTEYSLDVGSGVFESEGRSFGYAQADMDGDGFLDATMNSMAPLDAEVFKNDGEGGNYIQITLKGQISNSWGIGSIVDVYVGGEIRTATYQCGENYLGQNSRVEHLGLGEAEIVDSMFIYWPSGHIDTWYDVDVNESYLLSEGSSLSANIVSNMTSPCMGDTVTLSVPGDWETYQWSNNAQSETIQVTANQTLSVSVTTASGLQYNSPIFFTTFASPADISATTSQITCFGDGDGAIDLSASEAVIDSVVWEDLSQGLMLEELAMGWHTYEIWDSIGCYQLDSAFISEPNQISAYFDSLPVSCFGDSDGQILVDSLAGGTGPLEATIDGYELDELPAGTYDVMVFDSLMCSISASITVISPDAISVDSEISEGTNEGTQSITIEIEGGTPPYNTDWSTGAQDVLELDNLDVDSYSVLVTDSLGCEFTETIVLTHTEQLSIDDFVLFPNPADELIHFRGLEVRQVAIYDATGALLLDKRLGGAAIQSISISELPSGIYTLVANNGAYSHTFVKR